MTPREVFHAVLSVGLISTLIVGISQGKAVAIIAASVGLLASLGAFVQEHIARRRLRQGEGP